MPNQTVADTGSIKKLKDLKDQYGRHGPAPLRSSLFFITLGLELSDTTVYEP